MEQLDKLRRNIMLLRWIKGLDMALMTIPIIVIYFQQHGLTMQEVMWLQAIFGVTMIIVEIPSGYFSDVLGRKRTLLIGTIMHTLGWTFYAFAGDFTTFLIAELTLGIGAAFISGTDSAMLYDSLIDLGRSSEGVYQEGRLMATANFSEAGASVIGGLLALISMHTPFIVQIAVVLPTIPLALMLSEPAAHRRAGREPSFREIVDVVGHVVLRDVRLKWLLATAWVLGASTLTILWMYQPYWELVGVPVALFGLIWAGGNTLVGIASLRSAALAERHGEMRVLGYLVMAVPISIAIIGLVPALWIIPLFAVFYITRGIANPIFTSRINRRVESAHRATVLSVRQMGTRVIFVGLAPYIGALADSTSLPQAFTASSIIFGTASGIVFVLWLRSVAQSRSTENATAL